MVLGIIFGVLVLVLAIYLVYRVGQSESTRIRTLLRIYGATKSQFLNKTERELLEVVAAELILPGKARPLRSLGMTGKEYLNGVYGDRDITLESLIAHIIGLEFPHHYQIRHLEPTDYRRELSEETKTHALLAERIQQLRREVLGDV